MFKRITHTFIHVLDQDEALDFYVGKLGMVVHTDADLGFMRWLTVTVPDQPELELVLMLPGPPAFDDATAEQLRELVTKGAAGGEQLLVGPLAVVGLEDHATAGVEFTEEPTERDYGIDCGLRDPFGNSLRFTERRDNPAEAG
jgi:catechol 2,3-dioxygenase-like lactoylglutathione lyase family enzyme